MRLVLYFGDDYDAAHHREKIARIKNNKMKRYDGRKNTIKGCKVANQSIILMG